MNEQARLGLFVLIALIILGLLSTRIGKFHWLEPKGTIVEALFSDVSGIEMQTSVLMAGVNVGQVADISLEDNQALVAMQINPGIMLPASTRATIAGGGLVGEKYISLYARPGDKKPLPQDARIPVDKSGDFGKMISGAAGLTDDLRQFARKANGIADTVAAILDENRDGIRNSISGIESSSKNISELISTHKKDLDRSLGSLPVAINAGSEFFKGGGQAMGDLRELVRDNRENLYRLLFELRRAAENMEALSDDVRRNPWKLTIEKPEVPPSKRARQEKLEEMLMTTGRMGIDPAQH